MGQGVRAAPQHVRRQHAHLNGAVVQLPLHLLDHGRTYHAGVPHYMLRRRLDLPDVRPDVRHRHPDAGAELLSAGMSQVRPRATARGKSLHVLTPTRC